MTLLSGNVLIWPERGLSQPAALPPAKESFKVYKGFSALHALRLETSRAPDAKLGHDQFSASFAGVWLLIPSAIS